VNPLRLKFSVFVIICN